MFMAGKGNSRHMKSLTTSRYASIQRKAHGKYLMKPAAGRHHLQDCIPLALLLLKGSFVDKTEDAKRSLRLGQVTVNGKTVREPKYPVGLGDVVDVIPAKRSLQLGINQRGQISIADSERGKHARRVCKIVGKYTTRKNVTMVRLHDGANLDVKAAVKVNDSVLLDSKNAIEKILPLKEGANCLIINGVHVGARGSIAELKGGHMHKSASAVINSEKGERIETLVKNLMVIS